MLTKRTNILLDNQVWKQLVALAGNRNTSVGFLVRQAVVKTYFANDDQEKIASAVERIRKIRPHIKGINYKELISYGRKY